MAKIDPAILAHLEWLGFVQPTGLVVSAPALVRAGAILDRRDAEGQTLLRSCIQNREFSTKEGEVAYIPDFKSFASTVLDWSFSAKGYAGTDEYPVPSELVLPLPDYGETLRPDFAVRELEPKEGSVPWQLIVRTLQPGTELDKVTAAKGKLEASPHGRMERLLRHTGVPAGLLFNGRILRLISAPHGESSGWLDFLVTEMVQTAGRPISTALRLLLKQHRLLALPRDKRLTALLEDSRKFQNEVSERLAEQVLHGLYKLLRGLQSAHDASKGKLLHYQMAKHPDEIYRAMLTVILRLVFLLYAEERGMLPDDESFLRYYSLSGLYERLRGDAAIYPDTMNQRYGAWAQLLVLFRMIYDGAECGAMRLPKRHGVLFDPHRFSFLEGRTEAAPIQSNECIEPPLIPDGTIYRVLNKLLVLDGERISYRALDVEQIGSVYETMMGFRLETASGLSIAIKAAKKHGAPSTINLDALLEQEPKKRKKWVQDRTDRKLTAKVNKAVKDATTLEDLHVALDAVLDREATPDLVPQGAMILQPSEERRQSGSHYTPRALTEPIVRRTLEPILARLRKAGEGAGEYPPTPEKILALKVCDPAMGSGAFLVEACRQLGDVLIESWHAHDCLPILPADEDEVIFARRIVAQRCLYGVDRNPVAVDLAKVSLWLITLAREHALTFLDHALRHGDSLVGLTKAQIAARDWSGVEPINSPKYRALKVEVEKAVELRHQIRKASDEVSDSDLRGFLEKAEYAASQVRTYGDLVIEAFFAGSKDKERMAMLAKVWNLIASGEVAQERPRLDEMCHADPPLAPFHWELEFPEVFERDNPGFDAIVGNPPFAGKNSTIKGNRTGFVDWIMTVHQKSHGNSDLVAHFFRTAFQYIRASGTLGLVATSRIGEGDTRTTGLDWICSNGGLLFGVSESKKWPGTAAVQYRSVHLAKGKYSGTRILEGINVTGITASLRAAKKLDQSGAPIVWEPKKLVKSWGKGYVGHAPHGAGFILEKREAEILLQDVRNQAVIKPFLIARDLNTNPDLSPSRYIIDFGEMSEEEASRFNDCFAIVKQRVRPIREKNKRKSYREKWWRFGERRAELARECAKRPRAFVCAMTTTEFKFASSSTTKVFDQTLAVVFTCHRGCLAVLESSIHKLWAVQLGASFGSSGAPRYNPSKCFSTFPFPPEAFDLESLVIAERQFFRFREKVMLRANEGLTAIYNRFHDPEERDTDILKLRELYAAMDRVVLDAYGWTDIYTDCDFLLDYEINEENWSSRKRKPYRYRWPDKVCDEIFVRLLELNEERVKEETLQGELFQ